MPKSTRLSDIVVNAQADALASLLKDGFIDIYDGAQPESADVAVTTQRRCVSLKLGSPAFLPAEKGVLSANPIASGVAEADAEPATWARLYRADHKTPVMDVSVGTKDGGSNIVLPTARIIRGVTVSCTSFVHSVAKSTPGV